MSDFGLKRSDFEGKPGYTTKPAKVWRSGVGYVDGYKWRYRAPKIKKSKKQVDMQDLEKMIAPATRAHAEKAQSDMLARPTEVLVSDRGTEYVSPERAEITCMRNGWRPRINWGRGTPASEARSLACPSCGLNVNIGCRCDG